MGTSPSRCPHLAFPPIEEQCNVDQKVNGYIVSTQVARTFRPAHSSVHDAELEILGFLARHAGDCTTGSNGTATPGPLKCLCAPRHQISAKSALQKARNRNKDRFTTKLRKLSKDCANVNKEE